MARVLALVSPHLKGDDVKQLQKALDSNVFDKDFLDSKIDGEFGEDVARGCYRAQYWLGYAKPNHQAGTPLVAYLTGKRTLPPAYRERRAARIKKAADEAPMRVKAFREALTHVGVKESPPQSNLQMFGKWYGWNGVAWCAMFVSYCYAAAGSKSIVKRVRWAYCPYLLADAKAGRYGASITRSPKQGDIVIFGKKLPHHTEVFDHWLEEGKTFATVGGNTSPTNMANGGMVYHYGVDGHSPRTMSDVAGFVHLAA
jgi:hypothetical protein